MITSIYFSDIYTRFQCHPRYTVCASWSKPHKCITAIENQIALKEGLTCRPEGVERRVKCENKTPPNTSEIKCHQTSSYPTQSESMELISTFLLPTQRVEAGQSNQIADRKTKRRKKSKSTLIHESRSRLSMTKSHDHKGEHNRERSARSTWLDIKQ